MKLNVYQNKELLFFLNHVWALFMEWKVLVEAGYTRCCWREVEAGISLQNIYSIVYTLSTIPAKYLQNGLDLGVMSCTLTTSRQFL